MDKDSLHSDLHRRFSSRVKSITLNLGNFRYNHKDNPEKEDLYIHREQLEHKLESWLLNKNKSGSYLVTGYPPLSGELGIYGPVYIIPL